MKQMLQTCFPDARILLIVRRQDRFAESVYSLYLQRGGTASIQDFLGYHSGNFDDVGRYDPDRGRYTLPRIGLNVHILDFCAFVTSYRKTFGEDKVLVLPLELLSDDRDAFLGRIGAFMGLAIPNLPESKRVNARLNRQAARIARFVNFFSKDNQHLLGLFPVKVDKSKSSPLKKLMPKPLRDLRSFYRAISRASRASNDRLLTESEQQALLRLHRDANRRLADLIQIDLSKYGY